MAKLSRAVDRGTREGVLKADAAHGSSHGLRATASYSVVPAAGLLELGGDLVLNFGTVVDPYLGLGAGVATFDGARLGIGRAFVGLGPRLTNHGLFAEGSLNAYSDGVSEAHTVEARGGVNLFC